jgi:hypothetical protein
LVFEELIYFIKFTWLELFCSICSDVPSFIPNIENCYLFFLSLSLSRGSTIFFIFSKISFYSHGFSVSCIDKPRWILLCWVLKITCSMIPFTWHSQKTKLYRHRTDQWLLGVGEKGWLHRRSCMVMNCPALTVGLSIHSVYVVKLICTYTNTVNCTKC